MSGKTLRPLPRARPVTHSMDLRAALEEHFGIDTFRPGQEEAIEHVLAGRHLLAVMPTGGGKSLIYQLSACLLPGLTVVVSPLIALMKDQEDGLRGRGIPATAINSSLLAGEQLRRLEALRRGAYRLLYVAPERLRSSAFREEVVRCGVSLLAVDEAHCISQWGLDFRPDYLAMPEAWEVLGRPTLLALTATATGEVQDDLLARLAIPGATRLVAGFNRPNLTFRVELTPSYRAKLQALREFLQANRGPGIVYVGTRANAEEVAEYAATNGRERSAPYHGGMNAAERTRVQDAFMCGDVDLVVATNAFGMGVDRQDLGFVLHFAIPGNLESYYQEAGRAGRDGEPAECRLFYAARDRGLQEWFIVNDAPDAAGLRGIHRVLAGRARGGRVTMDLDDLRELAEIGQVKVRVGLSLLERLGVLERRWSGGRRVTYEVGGLSAAQVRERMAEIEERRRYKRGQLAKMIAYATARSCRRKRILEHFGDQGASTAPRCCDVCLGSVPPRRGWGVGTRVAEGDRRAEARPGDRGKLLHVEGGPTPGRPSPASPRGRGRPKPKKP